ncbi:MAG: hypothetical protein P1V20_32430 [Verrucomicrobiales bacterium]|nr:hypothetical protein [Verrucomicrobiales bacterium]
MTETTNNKPAHSIRVGNVRVAIWKSENGYYNSTVERSYKKADEWANSISFGRDDLPKLRQALEDAYRWIFEQGSSGNTDDEQQQAA